MNRPALVHATWLVVAIASFVLGARFFPAGGDAEEAGAMKEGRAVGRSGKADRLAGGGGGTEPGARSGTGDKTLETGKRARLVLSEEDIITLGEKFRSSASPVERRLAFSQLLEGLTPENARQIREQIAHMHHHSAEFREFHYAWGAVAGTEAIMFGVDTKEDDMSPALAGWASANPDAALAWFKGLDLENDPRLDPVLKNRKIPAEALRHGLTRGLVQGLADAEVDTATQFVMELAAAGQKQAEGFLHIVAGAVLRTGSPVEAASWAEGLPEGNFRNSVIGRIAHQYAAANLDEAAQWAASYRDRPEGTHVIRAIGTAWAHREPEKAVEWLRELPASEGRSQAFGSAFGAWAGRNPEEAGEYINDMPPSQERDSAISGFANRVVHEDPATGVEWAAAIRDPSARERALVRTGQVFYRRDANAAREWLAISGLSEEAQQRVIAPTKEDRRWNHKD